MTSAFETDDEVVVNLKEHLTELVAKLKVSDRALLQEPKL